MRTVVLMGIVITLGVVLIIPNMSMFNIAKASSCSFSSSSGSGSSSGSAQSSGGCTSITTADQRGNGGVTSTSSRHQTCTPFGESCTNAPKPSMCMGEINGGPNENIGPGSCAMGGAVTSMKNSGTIDGPKGGQGSSCTADASGIGGEGAEDHTSGSVSCSAHSP